MSLCKNPLNNFNLKVYPKADVRFVLHIDLSLKYLPLPELKQIVFMSFINIVLVLQIVLEAASSWNVSKASLTLNLDRIHYGISKRITTKLLLNVEILEKITL